MDMSGKALALLARGCGLGSGPCWLQVYLSAPRLVQAQDVAFHGRSQKLFLARHAVPAGSELVVTVTARGSRGFLDRWWRHCLPISSTSQAGCPVWRLMGKGLCLLF